MQMRHLRKVPSQQLHMCSIFDFLLCFGESNKRLSENKVFDPYAAPLSGKWGIWEGSKPWAGVKRDIVLDDRLSYRSCKRNSYSFGTECCSEFHAYFGCFSLWFLSGSIPHHWLCFPTPVFWYKFSNPFLHKQFVWEIILNFRWNRGWLTAIIPQVKPAPCSQLSQRCESPSTGQMTLLISTFALMSIGAGGIRPCSLASGEGQLERRDDSPKNEMVVDRFFGWY